MIFAIAMNSEADGTSREIALNIELPADGSVPEWIQLLPAGKEVVGRDGRHWIKDRPDLIIESFNAARRDLVIDWEHSSELKAPKGEESPAAGWGKQMEMRGDGEIWARTNWTGRATTQIANKEYRYISPVITYEVATLRIAGISSVGLTNKPNLYLAALNNENKITKEETMELAQLLAAVGLPATATFAEALNRIGVIKQEHATALNRADNPPLDKFVPRADYDQALNRATNAEQSLKEKSDADLETAINTEIDKALKDKKITPATADYHKAQCRTEGGLKRFQNYVAAAPVIAGGTGLDDKDPDKEGKQLNDTQKAINSQLGVDDETFKKYDKEQA